MNDGGPAFPVDEVFDERRGDIIQYMSPGMSLRDYFAAHAPAMTEQWYLDSGGATRHWIEAQSAFSYEYADAMLAARQKGER